MINCEIKLDLRWARNCITSETSRTAAVAGNADGNSPVSAVAATTTTRVTFQISNAKVYVPEVTLFITDNIKFLENIKQRFRRTSSWNKYRSEIRTEPKNNNLDCMIDPTFKNINRLFALTFKNGDNEHERNSLDEYYMPLIKVKGTLMQT